MVDLATSVTVIDAAARARTAVLLWSDPRHGEVVGGAGAGDG